MNIISYLRIPSLIIFAAGSLFLGGCACAAKKNCCPMPNCPMTQKCAPAAKAGKCVCPMPNCPMKACAATQKKS